MLLDLYQQKLSLFQQLAKLSQSMTEFTPDQLIADDSESGERFVQLLDERAVIIGQIDDVTEQIEMQESKGQPDPSVKLLKESLADQVVQIQGQSEVVEKLVERSLDQLRDEAKKLQSGKRSNRAYIGRVRSTEGSFIDKRR